ncbi:hypothetical protein [uncultured Gardnerella sp.]|uniref:hypothetical protein n=1 Tax=uncultured Gardnerella sp. TaxID=293424 RepID=UPI00263144AE|nr:hypothetical protein [uncultured Gardnerella sp.]
MTAGMWSMLGYFLLIIGALLCFSAIIVSKIIKIKRAIRYISSFLYTSARHSHKSSLNSRKLFLRCKSNLAGSCLIDKGSADKGSADTYSVDTSLADVNHAVSIRHMNRKNRVNNLTSMNRANYMSDVNKSNIVTSKSRSACAKKRLRALV